MKIMIANMNRETTEEIVTTMLINYGAINSIEARKDKSNRNTGKFIVDLADDVLAQKAADELNDTEVDGRNLFVHEYF